MSSKEKPKKIWEVDPAYRNYVSSHHPEAIEFIRKNETIKNKGDVWLDIQTFTEFQDTAPDGSYLRGARNIILFKEIKFDIFPRKKRPQYKKGDKEYNKYITWKTATEDIQEQRSAGYKGKRWIVECQLDVHKAKDIIRKELIPETYRIIDNPEYSAYLKSQAYQRYKDEYSAYESRLSVYKTYRCNFQTFHLPDGTTKQVLLYLHPEEKYEMLRTLGVSESEIQRSRQMLVKPIEPVPPPAPKRMIRKVIPAHYKERMIPGWKWHHYIKSVQRA